MQDAEGGYRYWRYVELFDDDELVSGDLEMLRRIDPSNHVTLDDVYRHYVIEGRPPDEPCRARVSSPAPASAY